MAEHGRTIGNGYPERQKYVRVKAHPKRVVVAHVKAESVADPAKKRGVGVFLDPFAILMAEDELRFYPELFLKASDLRKQSSNGIRQREVSAVFRYPFLVLSVFNEIIGIISGLVIL